MKKKKQVRDTKQSRSARRESAAPKERPPAPPGGPPLEGEALQEKVAQILCTGFRGTKGRVGLQQRCQGAEHAAIEAAIVSPRVQNVVEPVMEAFALEQTIAVICLLLCSARAALEAEKPTPAQVTALKIVFETLAEKLMERVGGNFWQGSSDEPVLSDYEKSLVANLLQLVRGQRKPATETAATSTSEQNED